MANIRITQLDNVLDVSSFNPAAAEFVLEQGTVSYKITSAEIFGNSQNVTTNLGPTTITDSFTTQSLTTLATLNVEDTSLTLNSDHSGLPTEDASFSVNRGSENNASIVWNETEDQWEFGPFPIVAETFFNNEGDEVAFSDIQIQAGPNIGGGGDLSEDMEIRLLDTINLSGVITNDLLVIPVK